jgi:hypothetical protein
MPYITTETYGELRKQRKKAQSRQPRYCRTGPGHEGKKMHTQLTLDEYCKPFLEERLQHRNKDQVLSKHELRVIKWQQAESARSANDAGKIGKIEEDKDLLDKTRLVTVSPAWLWLAESFVFTVFDHELANYSNILS